MSTSVEPLRAIGRNHCIAVVNSDSLLPRPWPTFALQFTHVHLPLQWCSVEAVNHFWAGSCIASQRQGVHSTAKHQSEHDAAVTQAVQSSCFTGSAQLQTSDFQHDARIESISGLVKAGFEKEGVSSKRNTLKLPTK